MKLSSFGLVGVSLGRFGGEPLVAASALGPSGDETNHLSLLRHRLIFESWMVGRLMAGGLSCHRFDA